MMKTQEVVKTLTYGPEGQWAIASAIGSLMMRTKQVAKVIGIDDSTVIRWADEGKLLSVRTRGGHRRFDPANVEHVRAIWQSELTFAEAEEFLKMPHYSLIYRVRDKTIPRNGQLKSFKKSDLESYLEKTR